MSDKNILTPRKALNKAFLKMKPLRSDITLFKNNLVQLLNDCNDTESEEFHKNLLSTFLYKTYYSDKHFINTKGRNDLVIHNGKDAKSPVGVIVETKKPGNKSEMLRPANANAKAMQELVLYYLRERITLNNLELKYLIATDIFEWYIFDAQLFEKLFAQDKKLVQLFDDFEAGRLGGNKTEFFYKEVAQSAIEAVKENIVFTHFDISEYEKPLRNSEISDDNKLISLQKIFSPEHLLKKQFSNDSNSLNKAFYNELLHIIGLTEVKDGSKKIITRKKEQERNAGSLLENAISQIDNLDKFSVIPNPSHFGETSEERYFNLGLELCITWINRILFLKLLEAQLLSYHKGNPEFRFMSIHKISSFDELNQLFFSVLAKLPDERNARVKARFAKVPYLNSSLFEQSEIEQQSIFISNLSDEEMLPLIANSVLRRSDKYSKAKEVSSLEYLFEFLDAYDFSSDGSGEIQEDNKNLINASVLGLIFEKINGYRDGSFFTPGFITMYMCHETIRRAVVQKFNETKGWNCNNLDELYNKIEDTAEANRIVNSIKICDPAVGSGHFLVSALNELISIKSELRILCDREGRRLKEYNVEIENDELILTDEDGDIFEYKPGNKESQRVQEALFHEKQTLIENCLFGVDINPNSVKICRLRLWIELLKNAYYKSSVTLSGVEGLTELETLPNIDINIKCGNSLISRYALDADIKQALKKSQWTIDAYKVAIQSYREASNKETKREMEKLINRIKYDFESEVAINDKRLKQLNLLRGELAALTSEVTMFDRSAKEKAVWNKKVEKLTNEISTIEKELEEIKSNRIYDNAFEWRFEFPEVLNDDGDFIGFDVVIGNPPYIRQEEFSVIKPYLQSHFETFSGTADLYVYFVERGLQIAKTNGNFIYILPNKWMRAGYGNALRKWIQQYTIGFIHDFGDLPVFEEATTYPCLCNIIKQKSNQNTFISSNIQTLAYAVNLENYLQTIAFKVNSEMLSDAGWTLVNDSKQKLLEKIKSKGIPLGEYVNGKIFYGIKTGLNEAFVIDEETKIRLIAEDPASADIIKPFLAGRDIKRYQQPKSDKYLILIPKGFTIKSFLQIDSFKANEPPPRYGNMEYDAAWEWFSKKYPAVANHLLPFKSKATVRTDKGDFWWELRACDYYKEFEKEKIIIPAITNKANYSCDTNHHYSNDKTSIIPTEDCYLLCVLNSKLIDFFLKTIASTKQNGFYEYKPVYISQLPIVGKDKTNTGTILEIGRTILENKRNNISADTTALESEIDRLVYELYGLSEEEVKIVES